MDGYPIRISGSGRISTIRSNPAPAGLHVTCRIGFSRVTIPVIHSAWCHCAVNSPYRRENLPMKPVWCSWHVFWISEWRDLSRSGPPPPFVDNATDQQVPSVDTFIAPSLRPSNWPWFRTASPSCQFSPSVICRRRQPACPASESSAPRETSSPTREVACHQITLKNCWLWKKTCLNFKLAATNIARDLMDFDCWLCNVSDVMDYRKQ